MSRIERHLGLTTITTIIVSIALFLAIGATTLAVLAITGVSSDVQTQASHREHSVIENCQGQNERHDNTIALIDAAIKKAPPAKEAEAAAGRTFAVLLINALQPHRGCTDVLHKAGFAGTVTDTKAG